MTTTTNNRIAFSDLNLSTPLRRALDDLGFTHPTTIQAAAFSPVMSGRDVCGIAQTGTGKTLAYLLPLLRQFTYTKEPHPQILIIVPTRELVMQVAETARTLTTHMNVAVAAIFGGVNMRTQMESELGDKCDLLVATPGRLLDAILAGDLKTKLIKRLVIDEVDEMLSLGFRRQIERVLDLLPPRRQNLLFSATMREDVVALMDTFFTAPAMIEAAPMGTPLENISQKAYAVPNFNTKISLLEYLLREDGEMSKVMIFTATKSLADDVYQALAERFPERIGVIHSNKEQNYRFNTVRLFADGTYRAIVSTDIIARGLDIGGVSHVVNFDLPDEAEHYIHRIGRTGRADQKGIALSFITPAEAARQEAIEALMKYAIPMEPLPEPVPVSDVLADHELPQVKKRELSAHLTSREDQGQAFHQRAAHNQKKNVVVRYSDKMKEKYGKPKTRGAKSQKRKK